MGIPEEWSIGAFSVPLLPLQDDFAASGIGGFQGFDNIKCAVADLQPAGRESRIVSQGCALRSALLGPLGPHPSSRCPRASRNAQC